VEYNIKAIPTVYAGVRFRSRLEARWAAFFDSCGWAWEYEPEFFPRWLPDFRLKGQHGPIYIEVKPIKFNKLRTWAAARSMALDVAQKALIAKERNIEALVIGDGPFCTSFTKRETCFGIYANNPSDDGDRATFLMDADWNRLDFSGSPVGRIFGVPELLCLDEWERIEHRTVTNDIAVTRWMTNEVTLESQEME
jgi:hypothetical protein